MLKVKLLKKLDSFDLDINLEIPKGFHVLYGASGCGKTMLLNCLSGYSSCDELEMYLEGNVIYHHQNKVNTPIEQRRIAHVFQGPIVFDHLSVEKNISLSLGIETFSIQVLDNSQKQLIELLKLEESLLLKANKLSGGQKQRLSLLMAIFSKPDLLLLDEPLSAFDIGLKKAFISEMEQIFDKLSIPIIYVTHDLKECLSMAAKIYLMDQGRIIAEGDFNSLKQQFSNSNNACLFDI